MATATNLGTGGSVLDAQYGSTPAPNTNEPLLLGHGGTNYLYLPGVSGNYAFSPNSSALNVTGDAEWVFSVAMDDWTPAGPIDVVGRGNADPNRAWSIRLNTTGTIALTWWSTGSAASGATATSTVAVPFADGQRGWVKVTLDVDNGASGRDIKFFTSTDGATFTQLGTTVTQAGATSLPTVTAFLAVFYGEFVGASPFAGKCYSFTFRNGIGGTTVFDADFTSGIASGAQTTFTESSANAATVTINRSTSGRKSCAVVRPVWLLGTDDYFEVADNALLDFGASDSFTVVAVVRQWGTTPVNARMVSKRSGSGSGYVLAMHSSATSTQAYTQGASGSGFAAGALALGAVSVVAMTRNGGTLSLYTNGTPQQSAADTSTSLSNANALSIGSDPGGASPLDAELLAVAVFRRALTAAELTTIAAYYGAS